MSKKNRTNRRASADQLINLNLSDAEDTANHAQIDERTDRINQSPQPLEPENRKEMSVKTRIINSRKDENQTVGNENSRVGAAAYLKQHLWAVLVIAFLALGILGAGLKYLDESAQREIARRNSSKGYLNQQPEESSLLNKVNPFLTTPTPTPTPQLSKELIYAGSRLLTVEDSGATAAPQADLAIWRPSSGYWWVMAGTNSQQATQQWGNSSDKPVPGDYDGDGKTDFAVFRPDTVNHTATWYFIDSATGSTGGFQFGNDTDIPAPADYDGDGKTDAALYRTDTSAHLSTWYIRRSSDGGYTVQQFGLDTDKPAAADYDGDGKADLAVWRSSNTAFYSLNSSNGQLQTPTLGNAGDTVVSADYDGDGKANYAIYDSSTANWYVFQISNYQTVGTQWGSSGDKPVPNDYDGDGKVDLAVWHDANGNWSIKQSASNTTRTAQWGTSGDIPVPSLWRR